MEEESEVRQWDELIPDALGLIFSKLPLEDVLTVMAQVCKSWNRAVAGPYCWHDINIEEWSSQQRPEVVNRMVEMLITRSCGYVRKLCVTGINDDIRVYSFIAENAGSLQMLRLPRCEISDKIVEHVVGNLSTITCLDLSYCGNITASGIETFGKSCRFLTVLSRNLHPVDSVNKESEEKEAHAIATTMPGLKRLELAYQHIGTESVMEILSGCPDLELIDLRGCWEVSLDEKLLKEKFSKLRVLGPLVEDYFEPDDWEGSSDYSYASDYWHLMEDYGEFYDDEFLDVIWENADGVELNFLDVFDGDAGLHGWPPLP